MKGVGCRSKSTICTGLQNPATIRTKNTHSLSLSLSLFPLFVSLSLLSSYTHTHTHTHTHTNTRVCLRVCLSGSPALIPVHMVKASGTFPHSIFNSLHT